MKCPRCHQSSVEKISQHFPSETVNDDRIENELDDKVDTFKLRRGLWIDHQGTNQVEKWLQTHPAEFAESGAKKFSLEKRWQVGVNDLITLVAMVLQMIFLERN